MTQEELKQLTKEQTEITSDDVVSVGYGYSVVGGKRTNQLGLVYTVTEKKPLSEIPEENRIPSEITYNNKTITTDVVEGNIKRLAISDCNADFYTWRTVPPSNRNTFRTLRGGVSVGNLDLLPGYVGTLGFLAIDNETNSIVGVSNSHVLVDDAWIASARTTTDIKTNAFGVNGSLCVQPSEYGTDSSDGIGILKRYVPIDFTNNSVDGALIALSSTVSSLVDSNSRLFEGLTTITNGLRFATTSEIDEILTINPNLLSSGRTTGPKGEGQTKLLVDAFPISILIQYNKQGVETVAQFDNLIRYIASGVTTPTGDICYDPISGGDSGSALIAIIGGEKVIIGLAFAGGFDGTGKSICGFACRIDHVAEQLNIRAWTDGGYNMSDVSQPETHIIANHDNRDYININDKIFWQMGLTEDAAS